MSILIKKNMKMPKNCDDCFLGDFYCEMCQHIDGYQMVEGRPYDCPLGDVPTPHGRLIDADALMKHCVMLPMDGGSLPVIYMSYFRNAPTIIEAEADE